MVAYKLYRAGRLGFDEFAALKAIFREAFLEAKEKAKAANADQRGPSYHVVRKHRTGTTLIRLVQRMLHEGNLSTTKAGKVLGVGAHNVHALISQAQTGGAA